MRPVSFSHRRAGTVAGLAALWLVGCGGEQRPDAYGNFEAVEVVVSAQTGGQVLSFAPVEGVPLERGTVVARIDTTQLVLEREQLVAQRAASGARRAEVSEQLRVLDVQRDIAQRGHERTRRLYEQRAATSQQMDQAERDYRVVVAQIAALQAARASAAAEVESQDARVRQIDERIGKSNVENPETGTVLATYTRAGEVVQAGQPLYKIANLDTLELRVYVSGAQLAAVRLGQPASVSVDGGDGTLLPLAGTVSWISATAEFTPTPVQTREDRTELVYAVKLRVPNANGILKIGMPGDVTFGAQVLPASAAP